MTSDQSAQGKVFTVGYGGREPAALVTLLQECGIRAVVDVRLHPHRASMGAFVKANSPEKGIEGLLARGGIAYHWLTELGNVFLSYEDWQTRYEQLWERAGDLFIQRLIKIPAPFCLLCAERDVSRCHRKTIADFIERRGWEIKHLT